MERRHDSVTGKVPNQAVTALFGRHLEIEQVRSVLAIIGHRHGHDTVRGRPLAQTHAVGIPDAMPGRLNRVELGELCVEDGGIEFTGQITRPDVLPRILVDLPAQETRHGRSPSHG